MAGFRSFVSRLVARIDERVDRDPDADALTGRSGSRRHGLPVVLSQSEPPVGSDPLQAQEALDQIRADQHRRMRRGTFGRRADQGTD